MDATVGAVVAAGVLLASDPLGAAFNVDARYIRVATLIPLFATITPTLSGMLVVVRRADLLAAGNLATVLSRLLLAGLGAYWGNVRGALVGWAFGGLIGAGLLGLFAFRLAWRPLQVGSEPSVGFGVLLRTLTRFGLHSSIVSSAAGLHDSLIPGLIGRYLGAGSVGLFNVARLPMRIVDVVHAPIRNAILPEMAGYVAKEDFRGLTRVALGYSALATLLGGVGGAVGYWALPLVIGFLYGSDFVAAVPAARVLLAYGVAALALGWTKPFVVALGIPSVRTVLTLLQMFLETVAVAVVLRYGAGIRGVAGSLVAGVAVTCIAWFAFLVKGYLRPVRS